MFEKQLSQITKEQTEQRREKMTAEEMFEFEEGDRKGSWLRIEKGSHQVEGALYEPESPNGETILFVPGSPGDSVAWFENRDLKLLLEKGYEVFVTRHGGVKINDYTKGVINNQAREQLLANIGKQEMSIEDWMKEPELAIEHFSSKDLTIISHSLGGLSVGNSLIELGKNNKLDSVKKWISLAGVTYDMQTFKEKTEAIWRDFANGYLRECCQYTDGNKVADDIESALQRLNEELPKIQLPQDLRIISVNPNKDEYIPIESKGNIHALTETGLSVTDKTLTDERLESEKQKNEWAMVHDFLNLEPETLYRLVSMSVSKNLHNATFEKSELKSLSKEKDSEKMSQRELYDLNSAEYVKATESDPAKRYLQYPESLRLVGDVCDKDVLDMGCGNGMFTRMMASSGARVVAYDTSVEQIKSAIEKEKEESLGIEYFVADKAPSNIEKKFDLVSAIMVLPCASGHEQLKEMFVGASECLRERGKFVCLTLNPEFQRFGQRVCGRVFKKRDANTIDIDFVNDDGSIGFSIVDTYFSKEDVENAAKAAGFSKVSWEKLHILPEGVKEKGEEYWKGYEEDCPYIGLIVEK